MIQKIGQIIVKKNANTQTAAQLVKVASDFFSSLYFFGISYEQPEVEQFIQKFVNPKLWEKFFSQDNEEEFSKLKFQMIPSQKCLNEQQQQSLVLKYKRLGIQKNDFDYQVTEDTSIEILIENFISTKDNQIIYTEQNFLVKQQLTPQMQQIFKYIQNPDEQLHQQMSFKCQITILFSQLMHEKENKCWKNLYQQIYKMILEETIRKQSLDEQINPNSDDIIISQYNASFIRIIMAKIEQMIKGFNKQFSNFCIILNDLGERCIYYFSIFIIWRLLCYGQWKVMSDNISKLEAQTNEQFLKFQADIQKNKREQSVVRGNNLATEIYNLSLDKFYHENSKAAQDYLAQFQHETNYSLVKHLDSQILEKADKKITDEQIMDYTRNHSGYIEKVVNKKITDIITQIQENLQQLLRNEIKQQLIKVQRNTRNLKNFSVDPINAQNYFLENLKNDSKINCDNLLFEIVLQCLQGVQVTNSKMIKKEYQEAFDITGFVKIESPLIKYVSNSSDSEIQVLMHFIQAFDEKISNMIKNCDTLILNLSKLNVQTMLDEIKLIQIGCLQTCPVCIRKCDQDPKDKNHRHACLNGHQLRGMNGVLIRNNPSLFTCEEITDEFQIEEQETKSIKKWKEIKAVYSNWQFSCLSNDDLKKHKQKFINIWNNKIGQMICNQLSKDLGVIVHYIPKHEIDPKQMISRKVHYILIMDDSGSMQGNKWKNVKQGAVSFMWEISKNPLARLTVIIFNSTARCVINFEQLDPRNQEERIQYNGGGTDFEQAFQLTYDMIINNQEFNLFESHQIFFYTDGQAQYPNQAISSFQNLNHLQKQKIELIACTEESQSPILDQIVQTLSSVITRSELRKSVQPKEMGQIWVETISKKFHKLEC